jgi:hypothetical protein
MNNFPEKKKILHLVGGGVLLSRQIATGRLKKIHKHCTPEMNTITFLEQKRKGITYSYLFLEEKKIHMESRQQNS